MKGTLQIFALLFMVCALAAAAQERVISASAVTFNYSSDAAVTLALAKKAVAEGHPATAWAAYLKLLDEHYNDLIDSEGPLKANAAELAENSLREQRPATLELFERLAMGRIPDIEHWETLDELKSRLLVAHRLFFWNSTGRRAREMLGDIALEEGKPLLAAYYYRGAFRWTEGKPAAALLAKIIHCYEAMGRTAQALENVKTLEKLDPQQEILVADRFSMVAEASKAFRQAASKPVALRSDPLWQPLSLPNIRWRTHPPVNRADRDSAGLDLECMSVKAMNGKVGPALRPTPLAASVRHFYRRENIFSDLSGMRPLAVAGLLIIPTTGGAVAVNGDTLEKVWHFPYKGLDVPPSKSSFFAIFESAVRPPCLAAGKVVITYERTDSSTAIAALDAASGRPLWLAEKSIQAYQDLLSSTSAVSAPVAADHLIVAVSVNMQERGNFLDYELFAIDAATGRLAWRKLLFSFFKPAQPAVRSCWPDSLVAVDGVVVASSGVTALAGLEARTGRILWGRIYDASAQSADPELAFGRTSTLTPEGLVVTSPDDCGELLVLEPQNGELVRHFPRLFKSSIAESCEKALLLAGPNTAAQNMRTGDVLWQQSARGRGAPALVGEKLFVPTEGKIRAFDFASGKPLEEIPDVISEGMNYSLFHEGGKLYVICPRGIGFACAHLSAAISPKTETDGRWKTITAAVQQGQVDLAIALLDAPREPDALFCAQDGRNFSARLAKSLLSPSPVVPPAGSMPSSAPASSPGEASPPAAAKANAPGLPRVTRSRLAVPEALKEAVFLDAFDVSGNVFLKTDRQLALIQKETGKLLWTKPVPPLFPVTFKIDGQKIAVVEPTALTLVDSISGEARNIPIQETKANPVMGVAEVLDTEIVHFGFSDKGLILSLIGKETGKIAWQNLIPRLTVPACSLRECRAPLWIVGAAIAIPFCAPFGVEYYDRLSGKPIESVSLEQSFQDSTVEPGWQPKPPEQVWPRNRARSDPLEMLMRLDERRALILLKIITKNKIEDAAMLFDMVERRPAWTTRLALQGGAYGNTTAAICGQTIFLLANGAQLMGLNVSNGKIIFDRAMNAGEVASLVGSEPNAAYLLVEPAIGARAGGLLKLSASDGKVIWNWKEDLDGLLWPVRGEFRGAFVIGRTVGRSFEPNKPTLSGLAFERMELLFISRFDGKVDYVETIDPVPKDLGVTALPAVTALGRGRLWTAIGADLVAVDVEHLLGAFK